MHDPRKPDHPYERDPFPKMFIVAGVIAVLLFAIVGTILVVDFTSRANPGSEEFIDPADVAFPEPSGDLSPLFRDETPPETAASPGAPPADGD